MKERKKKLSFLVYLWALLGPGVLHFLFALLAHKIQQDKDPEETVLQETTGLWAP
jgi:hypothetical protein